MIPRGIPIAQIDSNLESDPKFLRLRMKAPGSYYAALGTYTSIALRAWATASRSPDPDLLALMDEAILALLCEFALLDETRSIPEPVFDRWPGSVLGSRDSRAAQLASIASEGGKARARGPRDPAGRLVSPAVASSRPAIPLDDPAVSPLLSSAGDSQEIPVTGNDGGVQGGNGPDDPVVTYFELTTRYPKGNALAWVKRLGDVYGFGPSSSAMTSAWAESDEIGTLLSRTEDRLVASERAAELREKAEEKERLRQKRTTVRVIVDPGPEKVGALMGDIRKALGR